MRQLRVHQWAKNLLIFVPLVAAHRLGDGRALAATVMAFLAFCFGASAIYVLNDMIDKIRAGTKGGQSYDINLKNGGEVVEYNPQFNLPSDVKAKGDAAVAGIIDGSIKTGVTEKTS